MISVKDILRSKGDAVFTVAPDATVFEALTIMAEKNCGALIVLDGESVAGIISERDYARKVILHGKSSREMRVSEIMTPKVHCISPSDSVEDCMSQMTDKRVRHLPVMDGTKLAGVISIGDVVKTIIADQEYTIKLLEHYIAGTP
jgi:CBS domain-containing protein